MKKEAIIIDKNVHGTTLIAVDSTEAPQLLQYILRDDINEEYKQIRDILRENGRIKDKYCKCDVSNKAKNMFEMRFTRNGRNDRIYCQEVHVQKKRVIVMSELFEGKKSQEIPKKNKSRIETIGSYEYELRDK